jgi:hypothetical protein
MTQGNPFKHFQVAGQKRGQKNPLPPLLHSIFGIENKASHRFILQENWQHWNASAPDF